MARSRYNIKFPYNCVHLIYKEKMLISNNQENVPGCKE